jgi:hypothetical protein
MARSSGRYLWGKSLIGKIIVKKWIDFDFQSSAPAASIGRLYVDNSGNIKFSVDGTNWQTITKA